MLSIIVPCHNSVGFLPKLFQEFEKQSNKEFEIIMIDDCSNDGTYEYIQQYKEKTEISIVIKRNKTNVGPSESRKIGLKLAKGEFISFCDSDDWYSIDFVDEMMKEIEKGYDVLMCNNYRVTSKGMHFDNVVNNLLGKESDKDYIIAHLPMSLCRIIVKKELLSQIEFNDLYYSEDGIILIQIFLKANKIGFVDKPLYYYNLQNNSAHSKPSLRAFNDTVEAYNILKKYNFEEYSDGLEYYLIRNLVYSAFVYGYKNRVSNKKMSMFVDCINRENSMYRKNKYWGELNILKRIFIVSSCKKKFFIAKIYVFLHSFIIALR